MRKLIALILLFSGCLIGCNSSTEKLVSKLDALVIKPKEQLLFKEFVELLGTDNMSIWYQIDSFEYVTLPIVSYSKWIKDNLGVEVPINTDNFDLLGSEEYGFMWELSFETRKSYYYIFLSFWTTYNEELKERTLDVYLGSKGSVISVHKSIFTYKVYEYEK